MQLNTRSNSIFNIVVYLSSTKVAVMHRAELKWTVQSMYVIAGAQEGELATSKKGGCAAEKMCVAQQNSRFLARPASRAYANTSKHSTRISVRAAGEERASK